MPSHDRDWSPDLAVLPYADIGADHVIVRNIRHCAYESDSDYAVNYYDKRFELPQIRTVDFVVVPFKENPSLAHTMLSFGFADGEHVAVSAEARLEKGETYSPVLGELRQYELMYVVADERDVILRCLCLSHDCDARAVARVVHGCHATSERTGGGAGVLRHVK
ncbi:MAG: DUF4105 domain-containing protein [Planctomycetia bacterium]|nr:DUF4105 domain-containing protein [Planctomycetia bacterium]